MDHVRIAISSLVFARYKRKNGKQLLRNIRVVDVPQYARASMPPVTGPQVINTRQATTTALVDLSTETGKINVNFNNTSLRGYMRGRGFELVGYRVRARCTNINTRTDKPATLTVSQLLAARKKVS